MAPNTPNAKAEALERFLDDHVEPGTVLIANCHSSSPATAKRTYAHKRFVISGPLSATGEGWYPQSALPAEGAPVTIGHARSSAPQRNGTPREGRSWN
ncbi:MAG: hypothetical protein ACYDEY_12270 [Acidimicrobiales bacterium]